MAAHGYVTHAESSRRFAWALFLLYVLSFELIGTAALTLFLMIFDPEHNVFTDPLGYMLRYGLAIALLSVLMFRHLYRGHAKAVAGALDVQVVTRAEEPRFVTIAEQSCTALGVRFPRFGIIETPEPNALTVGEEPSAGLMVATRGLLDRLDDDEVAAGEAVRVTHFPEALLSALRKVGGRGAFIGSRRYEGLLFDGPADHEGGTHPALQERFKWIAELGGALMGDSRVRRDTRAPNRPRFGVQAPAARPAARTLYPIDGEGRPLKQPPTPTLRLFALRFTDPE